MATIVKLKNSDKHAILVGVGFGMFKSARPNILLGDLLPNEKSGESQMAAVSTASGDILWCSSSDLTIVSIDGKTPREHLDPFITSRS